MPLETQELQSKTKHFLLDRHSENPILSPNENNDWESAVTTNPGVWRDFDSGLVHMLYRACGHDDQHQVHLGHAISSDGIHFERQSTTPAFSASEDGFDAGCVEDPRIVKIGEWYYVTYATRPYPPGKYWIPEGERNWVAECRPDDFPYALRENATSTGLALTKDFRHWKRAGRMTSPLVDDRDVILFPEKIGGKYALLHRPMSWVGEEYGTTYPAIWISFSEDMLEWRQSRLLMKAEIPWECRKIGGNTPPIRTDEGWLTLYHAVGNDSHYRLGAVLLDLEEPWKIVGRSQNYILQPELEFETKGYYNGCIFPCGKAVIDGRLFVYYGAADKYIGLATCSLNELLGDLTSGVGKRAKVL